MLILTDVQNFKNKIGISIIIIMIDLFSMEFLSNLKQQMKTKTKTSKALIDAIKELRTIDQNNKRKITQLQNQIKSLKQQNQMLVQLLDSTKLDCDTRIQFKQRKIQKAIQIQAKLYAESEGLKKQVQKLKDQLQIFKNISITSRNSLPRDRQDDQNQENSMTLNMTKNEEQDLFDYLYSNKDKSQRAKRNILEGSQNMNDVSIDQQVKQQKVGKKQNKGMGASQLQASQTNVDSQALFSQILHGEDEEE